MDGWSWMDEWLLGWMDDGMEKWMDGWMDKFMNKWMDEKISISKKISPAGNNSVYNCVREPPGHLLKFGGVWMS